MAKNRNFPRYGIVHTDTLAVTVLLLTEIYVNQIKTTTTKV